MDDGSLGRLVNDSRYFPNAVMKNTHKHLCLFALKNIKANEEILYWYGEEDLPWHQHEYVSHFYFGLC